MAEMPGNSKFEGPDGTIRYRPSASWQLFRNMGRMLYHSVRRRRP